MDTISFGLLGQARIAENGLITPARATGSVVAAVAARNRKDAERFAEIHRIEDVEDDYAALVRSERIQAVYNPLVNGAHTQWNLAAIAAGKHVLSEKPFANNAIEAAAVRDAGLRAGVVVSDGSHFVHHPLTLRLHEIVERGEIGTIQHIETTMMTPPPPETDPRWVLELGGGALMDLACYSLRALRGLAPWLGGEPSVVRGTARERAGLPGVDEFADVDLVFPDGTPVKMISHMAGDGYDMSFRVVGSLGEIRLGNFALPHLDPQLFVETGRDSRREFLGTITSYCYQLQAFLNAIREGSPLPADAADAVLTMQLIDDCYRAVGLEPRPTFAGLAA